MNINTNEDRLHNIWQSMISRCHKKESTRPYQWSRYGGRGITVCEEWRNSFEAFEKWAYENGYSCYLVIDRVNNDGNYEPSNCQWITREENTSRAHKKIPEMWLKYHTDRHK